MSSIKRKCYTIEQKSAILQRLESGVSNFHVAKEFGVSHSTISSIKKNKCRIEAMVKANILKSKRFRTSNHRQIENALLQFIKTNDDKDDGKPLTLKMLQDKANFLAKQFNIYNFNCSSGWINRFKRRHNLKKSSKSSLAEQSNITICKNDESTSFQSYTESPSNDKCSMLSLFDPVLYSESTKIKNSTAVPNISEDSVNDSSKSEDMKKSFEITLHPEEDEDEELSIKESQFNNDREEEDYDRLNLGDTLRSLEEAGKSDIWDIVGKLVAANGREWAAKNTKVANQFKAAIYKLLAEFEERAAEFHESHQMTHVEKFQ